MLPRSVILAEDNIDDAFLTRRTLRKAGIDEVRVATNGQEMLDMLVTADGALPELLILDLRLPKINGLKVLTELRRHARTSALPVLILTSSEDPKDRETCLRLGAMDYLNKPLELQNFLELFG